MNQQSIDRYYLRFLQLWIGADFEGFLTYKKFREKVL